MFAGKQRQGRRSVPMKWVHRSQSCQGAVDFLGYHISTDLRAKPKYPKSFQGENLQFVHICSMKNREPLIWVDMWFSGTFIWSFHDGDIGFQLRTLTRNSVLDGIRSVKMPCMADLCQSKFHFFSDLLYDLNPTKTPHHPEIPNWQQHMGFYNLQTEKWHKWHKKTSTF